MISIPVEHEAIEVFDTIQKLTCISTLLIFNLKNCDFSFFSIIITNSIIFFLGSISQVYAFDYMPEKEFKCSDGWQVYDARKEFSRMGVAETKAWRFTDVNQDYKVSKSRIFFL